MLLSSASRTHNFPAFRYTFKLHHFGIFGDDRFFFLRSVKQVGDGQKGPLRYSHPPVDKCRATEAADRENATKKIKNKNVASSVGIFHSKQAWLCFGPCRIDVLEADDMGEQRSVWMEKLKTVAGTVLLVTLVRYI